MSKEETDYYIINKSLNKIKLSYETIIHKKVYDADCFMTIPQGTKSYALFYPQKNKCFLKESKNEEKILDILLYEKNDSFDEFILYGTYFTYKNTNFFNIEDLLYYKKEDRNSYSLMDNFHYIKVLLDSKILSNVISTKNNSRLIFGLPILSSTFSDIIYKSYLVPYNISYIQCRHLNKKNNKRYLNLTYIKNRKNISKSIESDAKDANDSNDANDTNDTNESNQLKRNKSIVFEIKAEIQNDVYSLYMNKNNVKTWYGYACIPDCKTSIFMNKLFRNIKENEDLDYLEESDSEEDFENTNINKYILNKTYNIVCEYNKTFNKWKPIRVSDKNDNEIVNYKQLIFIENNKK